VLACIGNALGHRRQEVQRIEHLGHLPKSPLTFDFASAIIRNSNTLVQSVSLEIACGDRTVSLAHRVRQKGAGWNRLFRQ